MKISTKTNGKKAFDNPSYNRDKRIRIFNLESVWEALTCVSSRYSEKENPYKAFNRFILKGIRKVKPIVNCVSNEVIFWDS